MPTSRASIAMWSIGSDSHITPSGSHAYPVNTQLLSHSLSIHAAAKISTQAVSIAGRRVRHASPAAIAG